MEKDGATHHEFANGKGSDVEVLDAIAVLPWTQMR